jgi:pimeloyl-ACP methyl ester carboxylesterase
VRPVTPARPSLAIDRAGTGPPLVLVHGLGSRRQIWSPVMAQLAVHHDVIAVDLPGFGESALGDASDVAQLTAVVGALADELCAELGVDAPHVAGNSLGGAIALELGRRGRAASVTAFSPGGFWHKPGRVWCQVALGGSRRLGAAIRPALPRLLASTAGRAALAGLVFGRPSRLRPADLLADIDALIDAPGFTRVSKSLGGYRFNGDGSGAVPTTIAWGSRDLLLTYALQHRRARCATRGTSRRASRLRPHPVL